MTATVACLRCSAVAELAVEDDDGHPIDAGTVSVPRGMLAYVCGDCLTDDEALDVARRSAAALLDAAEEAVDSIRMIVERVPAAADDPRFKAALAEAEQRAAEARAYLAALMGEGEWPAT